VVAAALCIAAAAAIVAILSGGFGDGEWQVIATSTLFALAASTSATGADFMRRHRQVGVALGSTVVAASVLTFVVVTAGIWSRSDSEDLWRAAGVAGIFALEGAHACFVLARQRPQDPEGARLATMSAVAAALISGVMGILAAIGLADHGPWQALAVVLIVQLLATALAPILRRTGSSHERPKRAGRSDELLTVAAELDRGPSAAEARALAQRLRRLAEG
jgi:hypothetical protein